MRINRAKSKNHKKNLRFNSAFTIIELIVVITIIAILAAIVVVSYDGWKQSIITTQITSDLGNAASAVENYKNFNNKYPTDVTTLTTLAPSAGITLGGGSANGGLTYCISAVSSQQPGVYYHISSGIGSQTLIPGECAGGWQDISTNFNDTCAVSLYNKAYCWGSNEAGVLGNNSATTSQSLIPGAVDTSGVLNGKTVTAISNGYYHNCAIALGQAYCWGYNFYGQLGNNSTAQSLVPVAVDTSGVLNGKTVTAITAGRFNTCAIASGQVYCWGYNSDGELGNNSTSQSNVPVAVDTSGVLNGKTVTAISNWWYNTCVVASGQAYCWGLNNNGQLGNNSTTLSLVPVAVDTSGVLNGKTVTAISAGQYHTCVVASGQAYCWGANGAGRLGNNSTTQSNVPVAVDTSGVLNGKTVTAVTAGYDNTCVIASDNKAYCWGGSYYGQNGNNTSAQRLVPDAVYTGGALSGKTITKISAGYIHDCAITSDNQAYCWGRNDSGQVGNNSTDDTRVPEIVQY